MRINLNQILVVSKRKILLSIIFGLFFSACIICGDLIYSNTLGSLSSFGNKEIVLFITKQLLIIVGSFFLFWVLASISIDLKSGGYFKKKRFFCLGWLFMNTFYVPAIIAFSPGLLAYDTRWQTYQIYGMYAMTNHHPLLHTYLWKFFLSIGEKIGKLEYGIMLYSIFQVMLMTLIFMIFIYWIGKKTENWFVQVLCYAFFVLNPTFHLLIIQSDKDVLFGGFMLLWAIYLIDAIQEKKISYKLIIVTILGCAFRHNGFYAILLTGVILLIISFLKNGAGKKYKKGAFSVLIGVSIYFIGVKSIISIMGIPDASVKEMLSVPCSQVANVYMHEKYVTQSISEDEQALILKYIPACESYNPRLADFVKGYFNVEAFEENPKEFIGIWLKGFIEHPVRYLYAHANLTIYYWCPTALDFPDKYSQEAYIQTVRRDPWDVIIVEDWNCWEEMRQFYFTIGGFENPIMRLPIIRFCFSLSFPFFMLIFCLYRILLKKEYKSLFLLLFPALYMCTLFVGPVCNYRYIFPLLLWTPLFITTLFMRNEKAESLK